jgi:hypothetical protein
MSQVFRTLEEAKAAIPPVKEGGKPQSVYVAVVDGVDTYLVAATAGAALAEVARLHGHSVALAERAPRKPVVRKTLPERIAAMTPEEIKEIQRLLKEQLATKKA